MGEIHHEIVIAQQVALPTQDVLVLGKTRRRCIVAVTLRLSRRRAKVQTADHRESGGDQDVRQHVGCGRLVVHYASLRREGIYPGVIPMRSVHKHLPGSRVFPRPARP
jgi:hypothetical protein